MWQSTLVLPVLHPNTTKSYSPDAEKYFDKQYGEGALEAV